MTIYPKKGILYVGIKIDGKWKYRSSGLEDTKENRRKLYYSIEDKKPELLFPLFSICADEFLHSKKRKAPGTIANYQGTIDFFLNVVGDIPVREINESHIERLNDFFYKRGLAHNTIASHSRNLRICFNYFKERGYIENNFIKRLKIKKRQIKIIPESEFAALLDYLKGRNLKHYRFIKFLSLTGFRISEAVDLMWEDVEFENNRIIFKNAKDDGEDSFPISNELKDFLLEFKGSGKVFDYKNTDGLKWLAKVFKRKLPNYSYHDIRRTFATNLLKENINPYKVMKLMRHKDFETTMNHYAFINVMEMKDDLDRVVKVVSNYTDGNIPQRSPKNGKDTVNNNAILE